MNNDDARTIWVSGAAGRLGGAVARLLRESGHTVLEADSKGPSPVNLAAAVARSRSWR